MNVLCSCLGCDSGVLVRVDGASVTVDEDHMPLEIAGATLDGESAVLALCDFCQELAGFLVAAGLPFDAYDFRQAVADETRGPDAAESFIPLYRQVHVENEARRKHNQVAGEKLRRSRMQ